MWFLLLSLVSSETIDDSIVATLNSMYKIVSGTSEALISYHYLLTSTSFENSTSSTLLLLTNSSLSSQLHLEYFELSSENNSTDITSHVNPNFEALANYTNSKISEDFKLDLSEKYRLVEVFTVGKQIVKYDNFSEFTLAEVVFAGNGALRKAYVVLNNTEVVKSYDWETSKGIVSAKKSNKKYLAIIGLLISSGLTAVAVYFYWNSRKNFPFLRMKEEEAKIIRAQV